MSNSVHPSLDLNIRVFHTVVKVAGFSTVLLDYWLILMNLLRKPIKANIAIVASAVLSTLTTAPTQAATYHLDFDEIYVDGFAQGNEVSNSKFGISDQWSDWGVTLSATNKQGTSDEPLLLFDSNPNSYTGGDWDLQSGEEWGTAIQNNVLIIHEDGFRNNGKVKAWKDPDDEAQGGIISFNFAELVDLNSISLLDVDDFGDRGEYIEFEAYDAAGNQIGNTAQFNEAAVADPNQVTNLSSTELTGNNSLYEFALSYNNVARLDVMYPGSGAIAGVKWSTSNGSEKIPEPSSTVSLLMLGAVGLHSLKHRRQWAKHNSKH